MAVVTETFSNQFYWKKSLKFAFWFQLQWWLFPGVELTMSQHWLALRWRHNGRDGISNHRPRDCLLNRLFRPRSKNRWIPCTIASNAENVSIWWRHDGIWTSNGLVYWRIYASLGLNELKMHDVHLCNQLLSCPNNKGGSFQSHEPV